MKFIREDIKRIKSKVSVNRGKLVIFDCLTREEEVKPLVISQADIQSEKTRKKLFHRELEKEKQKMRDYEEYNTLLGIELKDRRQAKRFRKLNKRLFMQKGSVKKKKDKNFDKRVPRTYKKYIKSKFWTRRKNLLFQSFGKKCYKCGSSRQISVHHLRYSSREYGMEKDCDLAILCWICHDKFHQIYGVKKDSHIDFKHYMAELSHPVIHTY